MKKTRKKSLLKVMLSLTFVFAFCVTIKLVSDHNEEKVHADNIAYKSMDFAYVDCSSLNVRTGPGTSYTSLGTIPRYTIVKISKDYGSWVKIVATYLGSSVSGAYVSEDYIVPLSAEPENEWPFICTGNNVNVRATPQTSGKVVFQLNKGNETTSLKECFSTVSNNGYTWIPITRWWSSKNADSPFITRKVSNKCTILSGYWAVSKYFKKGE